MRRSQCPAFKRVRIEVEESNKFGHEEPIDEDPLREKLLGLNLPNNHTYTYKTGLALEVAKQATTNGFLNPCKNAEATTRKTSTSRPKQQGATKNEIHVVEERVEAEIWRKKKGKKKWNSPSSSFGQTYKKIDLSLENKKLEIAYLEEFFPWTTAALCSYLCDT